MSTDSTGTLVENLFRREFARIVAGLTRRFGVANLLLAEDAAQDALRKALEDWPYHGVPDRPEAWLWTVAQRQAITALRRERRTEVTAIDPAATAIAAPEASRDDDVLRLMGLCCDPILPQQSQLALVLKNVCGFGIPEVASALLVTPHAIKRRLARARATLRTEAVPWSEGDSAASTRRVDSVLLCLYLLFNEGYATARANEAMQLELMGEALRCARILLEDRTAPPCAHALTALFCFLAARCSARLNPAGQLMSLAEQDRSRWDQALIAEGFHHFERALRGDREHRFHLEAAIAARHAAAPHWSDTPWPQILELYDRLVALCPSTIASLGRCVALAQVHGAARALTELRSLPRRPDDALHAATLAQVLWLAGDHRAATAELQQAIALEPSELRREFLEARLEACRSGASPIDW